MNNTPAVQIGARTQPAWAARCQCYNNHNSNSGRCNTRTCGGKDGVTDPTRNRGEAAICADCRKGCPIGKGTRVIEETPPQPTKPKKGDRVAVYEHPVKREKFEGNATVLRLEMSGYNDYYPEYSEANGVVNFGPMRAMWFAAVRFDNEKRTVSRWICLDDKPV